MQPVYSRFLLLTLSSAPGKMIRLQRLALTKLCLALDKFLLCIHWEILKVMKQDGSQILSRSGNAQNVLITHV